MAKLTLQQKRFLVTHLALFDEPAAVAKAFNETFGLEASRQQIWTYDAAKPANRKRMSQSLVTLFDETRARFIELTGGIAIAHKAYRLRRLDAIARAAHQMRNFKLEMEALEQAAKEVGKLYERGAGGEKDDPIHHQVMTIEAWKRQAAERRAKAQAAMDAIAPRQNGAGG